MLVGIPNLTRSHLPRHPKPALDPPEPRKPRRNAPSQASRLSDVERRQSCESGSGTAKQVKNSPDQTNRKKWQQAGRVE